MYNKHDHAWHPFLKERLNVYMVRITEVCMVCGEKNVQVKAIYEPPVDKMVRPNQIMTK